MGIREGGWGPWPDLEGRAGIEARGARPEVLAGTSEVSPLPFFIPPFGRRAFPGKGSSEGWLGLGCVCSLLGVGWRELLVGSLSGSLCW